MRAVAEPVDGGAADPTLPFALEGDGQPAGDRERTREILFLDPGVSDIETLLAHLRPEIEAILLDPVRPAARQMAAAVAGRHGLDAVHVIAHGAPGRVSFAAGDWSATTLEEAAEDLAAIGQALGAGRNVNLWSCHTAAGPAGAAFIAGLARASGADIAAATGLVGAAAQGGGWELTARSLPTAPPAPLTAGGVAEYTRVLVAKTWTGGATTTSPVAGLWNTASNWSPSGVPAAGDDVTIAGNTAYTLTLNVTTAALNSVTIGSTNASGATLAVGANTLNVNGTGSGATDTLSLTGSNKVTIAAGGVINATTISLGASTTSLIGVGTLNSSGTNSTNNITGTGTLQASGGTLDVFGTIASGVVLSINTTAGSDLKIEGTATSAAAISISNANQTLEIGAAGNLTISTAQSMTLGTIKMDGGR